MAEITTSLIKELRERTGVGMGKCKEFLQETNGDIELAIENLRKSGMASAVKKAGRETKEGQIAAKENDRLVAIVEVNAETDFVVKNDLFQKFLQDMVTEVAALNPASLESFLESKSSQDANVTIDQLRANMVQTIGENIVVKRLKTFQKNASKSFGVYSHLGGKIIVVVELEGSDQEGALAKDIAMHVAAASPDYLNPSEVPSSIIDQERDIAMSQLKGKPENIIEKILTGKIDAYYDQVCLTRQKFIRDDSVSIEQLVEKKAKETGKPLKLVSFVRWNVGQ